MVGRTIRDEPRVGVGFRGHGLHKKVKGPHVGGRAGEGGRSQAVYFAYSLDLLQVNRNWKYIAKDKDALAKELANTGTIPQNLYNRYMKEWADLMTRMVQYSID